VTSSSPYSLTVNAATSLQPCQQDVRVYYTHPGRTPGAEVTPGVTAGAGTVAVRLYRQETRSWPTTDDDSTRPRPALPARQVVASFLLRFIRNSFASGCNSGEK